MDILLLSSSILFHLGFSVARRGNSPLANHGPDPSIPAIAQNRISPSILHMLYKYLPPERIDVLKNSRIRFSQPSSLNDPYERMILVEDLPLILALKENCLSELDAMWGALSKEEKSRSNRRTLNKAKQDTLRQIDMKLNAMTMGDEAMKHIDKSIGILSLSRVNHSLLMWSHYASSFTGFVVGFDAQHEFFNGITPAGTRAKPLRVCYSSRRTVVSTDDPDY